jgi:hypothetical protein
METRQQAIDKMREQIQEDSKLPPLAFFCVAALAAGGAILSAGEEPVWAIVCLLVVSVSLTGGAVTAITKIYLKRIVELWLAAADPSDDPTPPEDE